jgi:hypothetical protein
MNEKILIKGYQPNIVKLQDGYQPSAQIQKTVNSTGMPPQVIIIPPQGGTGEITLRKKS